MAKLFSALIRKFKGTADDGEVPIREELYSVERLEQSAASLAAEHKITEKAQRASLLLPRLEENGRKLLAVYQELAESIRAVHVISPAAEWLVDNFHIVEEQVREIREDLPRGYYHELPKLAEGPYQNYPRIYAVAIALVAHTDSHLDTGDTAPFHQCLSVSRRFRLASCGLSDHVMLALVENLRRLATELPLRATEREEADELADKLLSWCSANRTT
jgi:cyclic beta-1,2-glucan synthetase